MGNNAALACGEFSAAADALRLDHHRLDERLEDLVRARDLASLATVLERVTAALGAHFLHEQSPRGPFDLLSERRPTASGHVRPLVDEHDRILALARGLTARARALADRERDLYEEAMSLIERIHTHETQEELLIEEGRAPADHTS